MTPEARISVCIVSFSGDAHAEIIGALLEKNYPVDLTFICPDRCQDVVSLTYAAESPDASDGYDVTWVRRKNFLYVKPEARGDLDWAINTAQANQDALDAFIARNSRVLVNPLDKAAAIENKATQLRIAALSGLKIPPTLISSNYRSVIEFERQHGPLIIKSMRSLGGAPTGTFLLETRLLSQEGCAHAPLIYQQEVKGNKHLRVAVFGSEILPFEYESDQLDSRFDARNKAVLVRVDEHMNSALLRFMEIAGLRMGIFDFKRSDGGDWYFLEINQQGAFAYLDPLAGYPILKRFAQFLIASSGIQGLEKSLVLGEQATR